MSLKGDLESMQVSDIFQWVEMNKKTGVLTLSHEEVNKCFCFKDGKIIFVSSNKEGERFGEFLAKNSHIDEDRLKDALFKSKEAGVPFTHYLIENKIVPREFLIVAIGQLAEIVFTDILNWKSGLFDFNEGLPDIVLNGPALLNTSYLVFESIRKHDEKMMGKGNPTGT